MEDNFLFYVCLNEFYLGVLCYVVLFVFVWQPGEFIEKFNGD